MPRAGSNPPAFKAGCFQPQCYCSGSEQRDGRILVGGLGSGILPLMPPALADNRIGIPAALAVPGDFQSPPNPTAFRRWLFCARALAWQARGSGFRLRSGLRVEGK